MIKGRAKPICLVLCVLSAALSVSATGCGGPAAEKKPAVAAGQAGSENGKPTEAAEKPAAAPDGGEQQPANRTAAGRKTKPSGPKTKPDPDAGTRQTEPREDAPRPARRPERTEGDFLIVMPVSGLPAEEPDILLAPLKVRIKADAQGNLIELMLVGRKIPGNSFDIMHRQVMGMIGGFAGPRDRKAAQFELELDCDYHLRYEYAIKAITAARGYVKGMGDTWQVITLIEQLKFAPKRKPLREREEKQGSQGPQTASELRDSITLPKSILAKPPEKPIQPKLVIDVTADGCAIIEDSVLDVQRELPGRLLRFVGALAAKGRSVKEATVIIRADRGVAMGRVQEIIEACQRNRFEVFHLRVEVDLDPFTSAEDELGDGAQAVESREPE